MPITAHQRARQKAAFLSTMSPCRYSVSSIGTPRLSVCWRFPSIRKEPSVTEPDRRVEFYRQAIDDLNHVGISYLVGGAFALEWYTGLSRWTKDVDIFIRPNDVSSMLEALGSLGYETSIKFTHWLAKAARGS